MTWSTVWKAMLLGSLLFAIYQHPDIALIAALVIIVPIAKLFGAA